MSNSQDRTGLIDDASRNIARWVWIINGGFFVLGAGVSTFVYVLGGVGENFAQLNRTGQPVTASTASALFSGPFFQLVVVLFPLLMDLRWDAFRSQLRAGRQARIASDPKFEKLDMEFVYFGICFVLALGGLVTLVLALSEASSVYAAASVKPG
uniref:hypothetical protein n=1 Tax=Bradyrhizobium sp. (strain ORS 278) TaxID=114615 RepID=UPI0002EA6530|nr:hypothetical protein [Bradyrhizobium sp. ORS 278]